MDENGSGVNSVASKACIEIGRFRLMDRLEFESGSTILRYETYHENDKAAQDTEVPGVRYYRS